MLDCGIFDINLEKVPKTALNNLWVINSYILLNNIFLMKVYK
jgi:hypothetical protein